MKKRFLNWLASTQTDRGKRLTKLIIMAALLAVVFWASGHIINALGVKPTLRVLIVILVGILWTKKRK